MNTFEITIFHCKHTKQYSRDFCVDMMGHVLTRREGLDRATDESTKVIQNIRGVNDNISKARKKRLIPLRDSRKCH